MKTSIALIVAETRRTVGRLARGAAAQARRVLARRPWIGRANECHHLPRRTQRRAELQPFGRTASLLLRPTRSLRQNHGPRNASFSRSRAFSALSDSISRLKRECSGSGVPSLIQGTQASSPGVRWYCGASPSWPTFAHWSNEPAGFILSAGTSEIVTTTLPTSKSAALATAEATAQCRPAGMPRVASDEAMDEDLVALQRRAVQPEACGRDLKHGCLREVAGRTGRLRVR